MIAKLTNIDGLSAFAAHDDLTVVESSWRVLEQAFDVLQLQILFLMYRTAIYVVRASRRAGTPRNVNNCRSSSAPTFLGVPFDIGENYDQSLVEQDKVVLQWARKLLNFQFPMISHILSLFPL